MRITSLKLSVLFLALIAALAIVPAASATTLTQGPYSANITVGATSTTLTLSGPASGFYVYEVAVNLGGSATSTGTGSASSGT